VILEPGRQHAASWIRAGDWSSLDLKILVVGVCPRSMTVTENRPLDIEEIGGVATGASREHRVHRENQHLQHRRLKTGLWVVRSFSANLLHTTNNKFCRQTVGQAVLVEILEWWR